MSVYPQITRLPILTAFVALCLALVASGEAQDADDSPANHATAPAADYSKGFSLLYKLGLPDTSKATYVRLQSSFNYSNTITGRNSVFSRIRVSGNAWLLSEKNGVGSLVVLNSRVISSKNVGGGGQRQAAADPDEETSANLVGRWDPVDLSEDVNKVMTFLRKLKPSNFEDVNQWAGELLLFAAHLSNHGLRKEANQIASILFDLSGSKDTVIESAVNILACNHYYDALDRLFASKNDWAGFEKDVTALASRYGSCWEWEPAALKVIHLAKMRAAACPIPEGLSDSERKLTGDLANAPQYRNAYITMWGLTPPPGGKHPIDQIMALGIKAIPLLVSLLKDDYPVLFDYRRIRNSTRFSERSGNRLKKNTETSDRPATRGEVAAFLLTEILPKPENEGSPVRSPSLTQLAESARAWYSRHKDSSPAELAMAYLAEGDTNQKQVAAAFLIDSKSEGSRQAVENFLLANIDRGCDPELLTKLAKTQGKKSLPFFESYAKAIGALSSQSMQDDEKKRILQEVENIKEAASGKTARQVVEDISSGKRKWEEARPLFLESLHNEEVDTALGLVLELALGMKDRAGKTELWCGMTWSSQYILVGNPGSNPPKQPAPLDPRSHAGLWKQLLADKSHVDDLVMQTLPLSPKLTNGELASLAIEGIYSNSFHNQQLLSLGRKLFDILRVRSLARIEGKPVAELPPLPSIENVSAEQKTALINQLSSAQDQEIPNLLSRLTPDEIFALSQNSKSTPSAKVIQTLNRITSISADGLSPDQLTKFNEWKGQSVSRDMFDQVLSCIRELAKSGKAAAATFYREAGGGIDLVISIRPGNEQSRRMPEGMVQGIVESASGFARNYWPMNDELQHSSFHNDNQKPFDATLNTFINGDFSSLAAGKIILLGAPASQPAPSQNSENE